MGSRYAWTAALAGGALLAYRVRARREPRPDPRADELRRRLEEAREREDENGSAASEGALELEARRRDVHEQGRAAVEEMRGGRDGA